MRRRVWILPAAAIVIAGACLWRNQADQTRRALGVSVSAFPSRMAPRFLLYDQTGKLVKFERYLGRTRIALLFTGVEELDGPSNLLSMLTNLAPALENQGVQVVAVTSVTPFAIREVQQRRGSPFPFPVLTDIDLQNPAPSPVHRQWGLFDKDRNEPRAGLFLIDRAGRTTFDEQTPRPVDDPVTALRAVAAGVWTWDA